MSDKLPAKPLQGVIANWIFLDDRISGTCVIHSTYENGIAQGLKITTSPVKRIFKDFAGNRLAETSNSFYILQD